MIRSWMLGAAAMGLVLLFALGLYSAGRPFRYNPLFLLGQLFDYDPDDPPPSVAQAAEGQGDRVAMVRVPAGPFVAGRLDIDRGWVPARVHLDAFSIDVHEVTNAQYRRFVEGIDYREPPYWKEARYADPESPVVGVSWYDARNYCWWARKRLPTETEWEKAARGPDGDGDGYPWGPSYQPRFANLSGGADGFEWLAPVGRYPSGASPYGAFDMVGNVWEWCDDRFDPNYYERTDRTNPRGPRSGYHRVVRGGSWVSAPDYARGFVRDRLDPFAQGVHFGFRCARDGG